MLIICNDSEYPDITNLNNCTVAEIEQRLDSPDFSTQVLLHPAAVNCLEALFRRYPEGHISHYSVTDKGCVRYIFTLSGSFADVKPLSIPVADVYWATKQLAFGFRIVGIENGCLLLAKPTFRTS